MFSHPHYSVQCCAVSGDVKYLASSSLKYETHVFPMYWDSYLVQYCKSRIFCKHFIYVMLLKSIWCATCTSLQSLNRVRKHDMQPQIWVAFMPINCLQTGVLKIQYTVYELKLLMLTKYSLCTVLHSKMLGLPSLNPRKIKIGKFEILLSCVRGVQLCTNNSNSAMEDRCSSKTFANVPFARHIQRR